MASIQVRELEFEIIAAAAWEAKRAGDEDAAQALDVLARKINAALSSEGLAKAAFTRPPTLDWRDMPSLFAENVTGNPQ